MACLIIRVPAIQSVPTTESRRNHYGHLRMSRQLVGTNVRAGREMNSTARNNQQNNFATWHPPYPPVGACSNACSPWTGTSTASPYTGIARADGLSIGLALAKRAVDRLSGEISVHSEPGAGSTFWFTARFVLEPKAGSPAVADRLYG
jgi:hypothetical protein